MTNRNSIPSTEEVRREDANSAFIVRDRDLINFTPLQIFNFGMEYGLVLHDCLNKKVAGRYRVRGANLERCLKLLGNYGYGGDAVVSRGEYSEIIVKVRPK